MLFVSFEFIFYFMPVFLAGYFLIGRLGVATAWYLTACSLFFYGPWEYRQVAILLLSVAVNYLLYLQVIASNRAWGGRPALVAGLAFNLGLLVYFKYSAFLLSIAYTVAGSDRVAATHNLPLGISFFTFTQIMFLVDVYRQPVRDISFRSFIAFVTFFPHLIAGPLLHHSRIIPQLENRQTYRWSSAAFATGLTLFVIGFFKKVVLADSLGEYSDLVFSAVTKGAHVTFLPAWGAALSYTFQLYFDFSAYCDMALGLSRMINIRMPINFYSPYKAASIREFWRRWHITLSFFLRNYLYIPMGGSRGSRMRTLCNLMATMLLAGLWHGAGWTFVLWGALHGLYLAINHIWNETGYRLGRPLGWALTFLAVVISWVIFRAETLAGAALVLKGMLGLNHGPMPAGLEPSTVTAIWIAFAAIVAFGLPNASQFTWLYRPGLDITRARLPRGGLLVLWHPTLAWSVAMAVMALAAFIVAFNRQVDVKFLYFQF